MILLLIFSLSFDSLLNQPELNPAQISMIVLDLDKDSVIYAYDCKKNMVPASNVKIVTAAAALSLLGSEYRYVTRLVLTGSRQKDRWKGDLIVIGGGDPSFGLEDLEQFVATVSSMGISGITGDMILKDDYFTGERLPIGWAWHYLDARYAPEISALSVNRNVVNVHMEGTRPGAPAQVYVEPATGYVNLINNLTTKRGEDSIIIFRRPEANTIFVDGGIEYGHVRDIQVSVKDPTMFFGKHLMERLRASGVRIDGECVRSKEGMPYDANPTYQVIDSVVSVPMSEIVREMNTESVNLYGEAILKTLGAHYLNEGSFKAGVSVVKGFLRRCGADTAFIALYDGSGLSRHNLLSSYDIMLVLRYIYHSELFEDFYWLLPGPGQGTLEYKFNGFNGLIRAKTGTLDAVSCLSGYLKIKDRVYCFSFLFNNFTCSNKKIEKTQDEILKKLIGFLKKEA
jgi:D-alanyl-D-alanine carboxypeptidase/D-alanyl-D-alanine-endopeptidase (penicillin-binding protein 4)